MNSLCTVAILATCLFLAHGAPVDDTEAPVPLANEEYRLPLTIMPMSYNITLKPYLEESDTIKRFTFDGEVEIEIVPQANTRTLIMHTKNLNYTVRQYYPKGNPNAKTTLAAMTYNAVTDIITYTLTQDLLQGATYVLHFVYTGSMDDDMHGFYRSSYTDSKNNTKWLASTQFQTNHARRAFPAFDEPKFKATFDVTIVRPRGMKTVSNTHIKTTAYNGQYATDVYATTPKMSTYLLAFIVSEFNERYNGKFGVVARPEYYQQTEYSFDVGQKILESLSSYLGLPYYSLGVDKMHMAAIPDFSAGAMENWGMLTYRERALLYDEGDSTLSSKQYIAAVVAHEQAHMWFGDLVTCDWWSYTWLNEGFARYFQYFGTARVETEMGLDLQFTVDQIQSVMGMDSTNSTNPMSDENTNTPADLSRMFNSISYNKGATIIRMIRHVIGEERFQKSLNEYLTEFKYKNTVPSDLFRFWKANWPTQWTAYADPILTSFTTQVGYPVVTIARASDGKSFNIAQKRFLLKDDDGSVANLVYTVPITYTTNTEKNFVSTTPKLFLEANTNNVTVQLPSETSWIIANIQQTGYYRVNYDEHTWHQIHQALNSANWSGIHEQNRAQIVDDLLNLARANVIDYDLALKVLEYLSSETNYLPWTSAFNGYNYLAIRLGTDTKNFGAYIRSLTETAYKKLGFEEKNGDSTLDIYLRAKVLEWSCKYGNSECISESYKLFNKDLKMNPVPVNIRSAVYCTALREGKAADLEKLFSKYKTETVPTEETLLLNSLGCVRDTDLVTRVFNIVLSDDVRRQDKSSTLTTLYTSNSENVSPVFKLVTDNFEKLADAMGGYSAVASVISNIASRFTEESQLKELQDFNAKNKSKFGGSAATLEAAERTVAENLQWANNRLGVFKKYLADRRSGSPAFSAFSALTLVLVAAVAKFLC